MKKTFDEVVLFARTGLNPRQNFKLGQGDNNYITIKNIKNNTLIVDDNTDVVDDEAIRIIHKRSQIKKGDILFASIGRMGDMYIIEENPVGWDINESVFAFTLDTHIVRQKYFYYIFRVKSTLNYLVSNSSGSTFKSIKMNQLKKMVFDIPSLEEQDQIIAVLDRVCNVIEKRKRELNSLDELIKARFVELFGDPIQNPKGYKIHQLSDYIISLTSGSRGWAKYCVDDGNEWFITIKNVKDCRIITDNMQPINAPNNAEAKRTKVKEGDLLISITADLGRTGVVTKEIAEHGAYINQHLSCIRIDREVLNPLFVAHYMESPAGKEQFIAKNQSAVKAGLNFNAINSLKLMVPPMEEQIGFIEFVEQVDKSKVAVQKALDETQLLFDSLMQQYFG